MNHFELVVHNNNIIAREYYVVATHVQDKTGSRRIVIEQHS